MKKNYTVTSRYNLYELCVEKNWFTCGSNRQYEKMFYANENGASFEEIVTIIWLCSDDEKWCRRDIKTELEKAHEEYLMDIAEQQISEGERIADDMNYSRYMER